jgi:hypothetical protein
LNLTANDSDTIVSWSISHTRYRADGSAIPSDSNIVDVSNTGNVPTNVIVNKLGNYGQTVGYKLSITDSNGKVTVSPEVTTL